MSTFLIWMPITFDRIWEILRDGEFGFHSDISRFPRELVTASGVDNRGVWKKGRLKTNGGWGHCTSL
jgi:hypothetical protein